MLIAAQLREAFGLQPVIVPICRSRWMVTWQAAISPVTQGGTPRVIEQMGQSLYVCYWRVAVPPRCLRTQPWRGCRSPHLMTMEHATALFIN
jgi:hypothetical protein